MSDDMTHARWDELVAAHALHACEPDEEAALLGHLEQCAHCRSALERLQRTAADLAYLSGPIEPPRAVWSRISAEIGGAEQPTAPADHPASGRRLRAKRGWPARPAVLAAAAALVALLGVGGWQAATRLGTNAAPSAVAACRSAPTCRVVALAGEHASARLLVRGSRAELVPGGLPPLSGDMTYVLWQLPRDGSPQGLAAFGVSAQSDRPALTVTLPRPYTDTAAFAISRERGHTVPAAPSTIVAVGPAGT